MEYIFVGGREGKQDGLALTHRVSNVVFRLQNLTAAVHAGLQVDVVRAMQFASFLVLDIGAGFLGMA